MLPEDRLAESLDALLAAQRPHAANSAESATNDARRDTPPAPAELGAALQAAERLGPVRSALPPPEFTQTLENRLFDQLTALREARKREDAGAAVPDTVVSLSSAARRRPSRRPNSSASRHPRRGQWRVWQTLAAAVILAVVGASVLAATAASAAPGAPLYGLKRWEQDLRAGLGTSPADQVRLHLQYASDALDALNAAISQQAGSDSYRAAIGTTLDEEHAAATALSAVSLGSDRTSLTVQLAALRQREARDLHASLLRVPWQSRLFFTTTLGVFGETVPVVTSARVERGNSDGGSSGDNGSGSSDDSWTVELTGSGFQPGAVCVIDGQPVGVALSVTPTQMVVVWPGTTTPTGSAFGLQNPDGTAAQSSNVQRTDDGDNHGGDTATPTTSSKDGGGNGSGGSPTPTGSSGSGDGHGGSGQGGSGQSTPTATPTPNGGGDGSGH